MKNLLFAITTFATIAVAQRPEFDVATVKPNNSAGGVSSTKMSPGSVFIENASLSKCISLAYGISEDRADSVAGPDWLRTERFDITAKFPSDTPGPMVRTMLQNLLVDRFRLNTHRENKELQIYALVVGRNGPKMREAAADAKGSFSLGAGHIAAKAAPMQALADRLSSAVFQLGRPVQDGTGLKGVYDFTLEWTPDSTEAPDSPGPSLFTAIQEQLGLKLEPQKSSVEILVVDSAERKPSAN